MKYMIVDPDEGIFLGTTREEPNSMFGGFVLANFNVKCIEL